MIIYYGLLQVYIFLREILFVILKPRIWKFYLYFSLEYLFFSPYYYVNKKSENDHIFGFTPLFTINRIIKKILKNSTVNPKSFLDVGCGDSRLVFFLNLQYLFRSMGIDSNQKLIHKANLIQHALNLNDIDVIEGDFLDYSWAEYAIIYLAWTTFKKGTVNKIMKKIKEEVLEGTIVISLSFPLTGNHFQIIDQSSYLFSWGRTTVYTQKRVKL
ncbi:MAG: hypothetical protein A2Y40_03970 [Candidatus Margulisbacteria bacterium GWF2_35_9]|nr:MAG: hypothetical protein A2Y40_03970 [Candidatus Margulisbacteria bacterium GWF2_35_9]